MVAWLKEEWQGVLVVGGIAIVGGLVSGAVMMTWFYQGICR